MRRTTTHAEGQATVRNGQTQRPIAGEKSESSLSIPSELEQLIVSEPYGSVSILVLPCYFQFFPRNGMRGAASP